MPFSAWFLLGLVAAAFVPGTEFLAVALIWSGLALGVVYWIAGQGTEAFTPLVLSVVGFFVLFLRRQVASRLW